MALHESPPEDLRPGLPPPQFRLATLFGFVAGLCCLLVVMNKIGPLASCALVFFLLAIAAHVAGNALGSRLRDNGGRPPRRFYRKPAGQEFAPATQLCRRTALGWPLVVFSTAGVLVGGFLGGFGLAWINWPQATVSNMLLATISSAVLGGFAGFTASSFAKVAGGALAQAINEPPRR